MTSQERKIRLIIFIYYKVKTKNLIPIKVLNLMTSIVKMKWPQKQFIPNSFSQDLTKTFYKAVGCDTPRGSVWGKKFKQVRSISIVVSVDLIDLCWILDVLKCTTFSIEQS